MTFADGFFDYFKNCPLLDRKKLNFGYHNVNPDEYYLDTEAPDSLIKIYTHGNAIWQKPIYFRTVAGFGPDARVQIKNKVEFEKFRDWVDEQNTKRNWPQLPENCHPISLECTTDGYIFDTTNNTAQYQIQMLLTYQRNRR